MTQFGKRQATQSRQAARPVRPRAEFLRGGETSAGVSPVSGLSSAERSYDFMPPGSAMHVTSEEYAGFLPRVGAFLVDGVLITLPFLFVFGSAIMEKLISGAPTGATLSEADILYLIGDYILLYFGVTALYYSVQEASGAQATLGKRLFGIRLVRTDGAAPSFGNLLLRNTIGRFLVYISPVYIGFTMCLFTKRKQCLHDMIGGVTVCRKDALADNCAAVFA